MKNHYTIWSMVLIWGLFIVACKNTTASSTKKRIPISVSAVPVKQNDIKEYLTFNGVTQYQKKENIRSNVTGYIFWMKFKIGDPINKGQTFALIRTKEQDALQEALKIDSSLAKFSSPLRITGNSNGVISTLNVQQNDYVAEGDVLATVIQPRSLVVQVNVPFKYGDSIKVGKVCQIVLQNDIIFDAQITGKLPIIDPVAQSQKFFIALPNAGLPENLNVRVRTVYREAKNALAIPHNALQTNELLTYFWVMKVVGDSLAIKEKVTPLIQTDSLVQIVPHNIKANDMVVTEGSYQMQDSTLISIRKE